MPVVRKARSPVAAKRWRDENLEYWARHGLEGEADEILAELERRKRSTVWLKGFIPSPINFLRRASWRRRPEVRAPKVWGPVEVFEPSPSWRPPAEDADKLKDYLKSLAKGLS